jgi:hypothetical protein
VGATVRFGDRTALDAVEHAGAPHGVVGVHGARGAGQ